MEGTTLEVIEHFKEYGNEGCNIFCSFFYRGLCVGETYALSVCISIR